MGEEYRDEYVRNWTTIWTNILIGRTGGTERKSLANREGMEKYLSETLKYNKPYDEMAKELITATGSCRPGDEDFNGAANFLADKMADNGVQATAKTVADFPRHGGAVHAVPQPSVQRVQAEPVLGDERVLPADAGRADRHRREQEAAVRRPGGQQRLSAAKAATRTRPRFITSCGTAS